MSIKRKTTQYDVEHGGTFNNDYVPKGITYYEDNEETNAADKHVNSPDLTFTDTEHLEEDEEYPHLDVNGDTNITHDTDIGHNLTVHNDTLVEGNTHLIGKPEGEDGESEDLPALTVENNTVLKGQKDDDDEYVGYALDVEGKTHLENTLEVEDKSWFRDDVDIHGTTTITGDLHVRGTSYEEHAVDLNVGADFVRVRENADVALAEGERSGIIINNYDGQDSLGIVADPHGTLRIGEFNTVKVYTKDDITYYSDRELTTETEIPVGKRLYQIGEEDPETGLKEYYYIAKDDTEPVATRGSSDDMEDQHLTKWSSDGEDILTTATTSSELEKSIDLGKNLEQRVIDLEAGKLNIDATKRYPVTITRTDNEEWTELNTAPVLTRTNDAPVKTGVNTFNRYESAIDYYQKVDDEYVVVPKNNYWIDEDDNISIGPDVDNLESLPTLYFKTGNNTSNNYDLGIEEDNVIRYFYNYQDFIDLRDASLEAYENDDVLPDGTIGSGTFAGQVALKENNVIMIRNAFGTTDDIHFPVDIDEEVSSPIGITDHVAVGNYNPVTSNAVAKALIGGMAEALSDGRTIKATEPEYGTIEETGMYFRNTYFYASGEPRAEALYYHDENNGMYYAFDRVETDDSDLSNVIYHFIYKRSLDIPEEEVIVGSDELVTFCYLKTPSVMYGNYDNDTIGYDSSLEKVKVNIDSEPNLFSELPLCNRQVTALHNASTTSIAGLRNDLTNETTRATTAEDDLAGDIATVAGDLATEITDRTTAITNEVAARNTAITNAINNLDVAQVGGANTYIQYISESNGKIAAHAETFPTQPTFSLSGTTLYITR